MSSLNLAFRDAILNEHHDAIQKIEHCLGQLSDEQVWWRPSESMNSVGNLVLHICGNVRQWVVSGVGGAADRRNRPQEFAHRDVIPKSDLLQMIQEVKDELKRTLDSTSDDEYIRRRVVQAHDVSGIEAVIHSVAHYRGHVQEMIHMTRIQLGDRYQFDFVPTPEQQGGAAVQPSCQGNVFMSFIDLQSIPAQEVMPGCRLRTPYGKNLMLSYLEMDEDAVIPLHDHPHEQGGILLEGKLKLTIGDETRVVEPGALFLIPPNVPHQAVAVGGPARVLDVFSPIREDYAELMNHYIPGQDANAGQGGPADE